MKKRISRKQWRKAPKEVRRKFNLIFLPNIGDLIAYLEVLHISPTMFGYSVFYDEKTYFDWELVDALWKAVLKHD